MLNPHANPDRAELDFETRSACDIGVCGSWRYSLDPTTEVLCMAFRLPYWDEGRAELWHPAFPHLDLEEGCTSWDALEELFAWIAVGGLVEAHNAWFERGIWVNILEPQGWPTIHPEQWRCSAAKAASHALPRALEDAVEALNLPINKDLEGHALMKKMAKPRKPTKADWQAWHRQHAPCKGCDGTGKVQDYKKDGTPKTKLSKCGLCKGSGHTGAPVPPMPLLWLESKELFHRLFAYCVQDILAEKALSDRLIDLNDREGFIYMMDQIVNERGFMLDREAVDVALELVDIECADLNKELCALTDGQVERATQRQRMLAWFEEQGCRLDDTRKETITAILDGKSGAPWHQQLSDQVRRGLELMKILGRSSTAKYCVDPQTRVLKTDLTWINAGAVTPGDTLLAFDESSSLLPGKGRSFQPARVVASHCIRRPRVRVTTTEGSIVVSTDHPFLLRARAFEKGQCRKIAAKWCPAESLSIGDEIVFLSRPWETDNTREGGYLAGFLDGEGSVNETRSSWAQNQGKVQQYVSSLLAQKGINFSANVIANTEKCLRFELVGGVGLQLEVLGRFRPHRLLQASERIWRGRRIFSKRTRYAAVLSVEPLAAGDVIAIATTTHTLITNGFFSHNCAMKDWVCPDSRVHGGLLYHGASTGRWTGTGVQPHNFVKGRIADMEQAWEVIKTRDRERIITEIIDKKGKPLGSVMDVLAEALRGAIIPSPGKQLYVADFAGIEARVLLWVADDTDALDIFRTGADIYCYMASDIYGYPCNKKDHPNERGIGKIAVLGLGYQMGWKKFIDTAAAGGVTIDETFARQVVDTYREKFWRVKQLWWDVEDAAINAVEHPDSVIYCGKVSWSVEDGFLYCRLPSGRCLAYAEPELRWRETPWGDMRRQLTFKGVNPLNHQWQRQTTYGGSLVENIVQAVSRDLMAEAMWRCEQHPTYKPVLSVHDEMLAEADLGAGDVKEFEHLMAALPDWAEGCPVEAEGWRGLRYRK